MALINKLNWRYATKKFDTSKKVEQELIDQIIEAAWLAPTSSGLQPFRVIEITDDEKKKEIVSIAYNQQQVVDCSHLLVFAAWDNYTEDRIDNIYNRMAAERGQDTVAYKDYTDRLKKTYLNRSQEENFIHIAHQAYIALGFSVAMAADLNVDATPMEGFDSVALDNMLELEGMGFKSVLLLPLGYRDIEKDWLAGLAKVRHAKEEFLLKI